MKNFDRVKKKYKMHKLKHLTETEGNIFVSFVNENPDVLKNLVYYFMRQF